MTSPPGGGAVDVRIPVTGGRLHGSLRIGDHAVGIVVFAHGTGSNRLSPRNTYVADRLVRAGFGTLLLDLLTEEEAAGERTSGRYGFDIDLLSGRLVEVTDWLIGNPDVPSVPLGYFGASTGAAAALRAAGEAASPIEAIVLRGGRPDLVGAALTHVDAPTLLIVGGEDRTVLDLNREAARSLACEHRLEIVECAGHLFEEPGALDKVVRLAISWFDRCFVPEPTVSYGDRIEAGRVLGRKLAGALDDPSDAVVLGLPRGGVPVALEISRSLGVPVDVLIVRKLGVPGQEELAMGAVASGGVRVLNTAVLGAAGVSGVDIDRVVGAELREVERRERLYRGWRQPAQVRGRTVVLVDDGVATGSTVRAAISAIRSAGPKSVVVAVPVAPRETYEALLREADEVVAPLVPHRMSSIGEWYRDFHQLSDDEVIELLRSD